MRARGSTGLRQTASAAEAAFVKMVTDILSIKEEDERRLEAAAREAGRRRTKAAEQTQNETRGRRVQSPGREDIRHADRAAQPQGRPQKVDV